MLQKLSKDRSRERVV